MIMHFEIYLNVLADYGTLQNNKWLKKLFIAVSNILYV